jgi:hypothetical protein
MKQSIVYVFMREGKICWKKEMSLYNNMLMITAIKKLKYER